MSTAVLFLKGSFARTLETIVAIATGFFLLPFLVNHLGEHQYGLWILVSSLTAAFYLFDLGFASAVTRFVASALSKNNHKKANEIISTALLIYGALAIMIVISSTIVAAISPYWVESPENERLVQILIVITGTTLAIEFPFKAFAGVAASYMRYDLLSYSRIGFKLASTVAIVLLVNNGYSLIAIATVGLLSGLLSNIVFLSIARSVYRQMNVARRLISRGTIRELFGYSAWAFAIDITQLAKNKADIFIIGSLLSTAVLTTYYVAVRLADYALEFLVKAMSMTTPIFARAHASGTPGKLKTQVLMFCRLNTILAGLCATVLIGLGEMIIRAWMGSDFNAQLAHQALVFLVIGKMIQFSFSPLSSCLYAISKHKYQALIEVVEALIAIPASILLIKYGNLGILGAAIGITVPLYFTRGFLLPYLTAREIGLRVAAFYRETLAIITYAVACIFSVTWLVERLMVESPALPLLISMMALSTLLYCAGALLLLNASERSRVVQLLHRLRARTNNIPQKKAG